MLNVSPRVVRRNKIIQAALVIFAEKGFQDTTISEISKAANVSEATVYEYFKTKEELLFAIPEEITEEAYKEWMTILPYLRGTESKIRAMVQGYMKLYMNNAQYTSLIMLQLKSSRNFLKTDAYNLVREVAGKLLDIIQEGVKSGDFKKDTDALLVRSMILGTIEHVCIRWLLLGDSSDLIAKVDPLVDIIFDGIRSAAPAQCCVMNLKNAQCGIHQVKDAPESES